MTTLTVRPARLPEADAVYQHTRRDIDPETGEATAQALWDRHAWEPGECWLWCGRAGVEVTWLGPVRSSGIHADLYACRACLYLLDQRVLLANMRKDGTALQNPAPAGRSFTPPAGAGRHRKKNPNHQ